MHEHSSIDDHCFQALAWLHIVPGLRSAHIDARHIQKRERRRSDSIHDLIYPPIDLARPNNLDYMFEKGEEERRSGLLLSKPRCVTYDHWLSTV